MKTSGFKASLILAIWLHNFKIKVQKKKPKQKTKTHGDHSCVMLIPSILMERSHSIPVGHIYKVQNVLLGWKNTISHFKHI